MPEGSVTSSAAVMRTYALPFDGTGTVMRPFAVEAVNLVCPKAEMTNRMTAPVRSLGVVELSLNSNSRLRSWVFGTLSGPVKLRVLATKVLPESLDGTIPLWRRQKKKARLGSGLLLADCENLGRVAGRFPQPLPCDAS